MAKKEETSPAGNEVNFTVAGETVSLGESYIDGQTINEAEASVLNQVLRENIRNGVATRVKENPEDAQAIVSEYADSYAFGVRRARASLNPVQAEAKKIAVLAVNAALAQRGIKKADYADYDAAVAATMAQEKVQAQAQKIVAILLSDDSVEVAL